MGRGCGSRLRAKPTSSEHLLEQQARLAPPSTRRTLLPRTRAQPHRRDCLKALSDGLVWALEAGLLGTAALASSPLASPALQRAVDEMAVRLTRLSLGPAVKSVSSHVWL